MATKKVAHLPAGKNSQAQDAEAATKAAFLARTDSLCRHVTAWGGIEDVGDLYESTITLVRQMGALFDGLYQFMESTQGGGDERLLVLCDLGADLAEEVKRRVDRLYDQT